LVEGQALEVEIVAEAREGKGAVARVLVTAEGPPRLTAPAPDIAERLAAIAPGMQLVEGRAAREAADAAQAAALAIVYPLPGGGALAIEPTRALTAIDIDVAAKGGGDSRRAARQVNLTGIAEGARLLRLKGLGGLVVFDLVGKGHDGAAISAAAKAAFAPEGPAVSIGPISRFGLFELSLPRTVRPLGERLLDGHGALSAMTAALSLARRIQDEGRANAGAALNVTAALDVIEALSPHMAQIIHQLGDRVRLKAVPGLARIAYEIVAR
jgi:Ribonuclease G/E